MTYLNGFLGAVVACTVTLSGHVALGAGGGGGTGGGDATPPKATETTTNCFDERQWDPEMKRYVRFNVKVNGVWDPKERKCIRPDKAGYLQSHLLEDAVRELAYAGRVEDAQKVLSQMDQSDDLVLTYWGFTHRKLGDLETANRYYQAALTQNPNNVLARSYMGQGFVAAGDYDAARAQLREIRTRGGTGTWADISLTAAIKTGQGYSY